MPKGASFLNQFATRQRSARDAPLIKRLVLRSGAIRGLTIATADTVAASRSRFPVHVNHFQQELAFLGIGSPPAYVRSPKGNGCAESFIRTLAARGSFVPISRSLT